MPAYFFFAVFFAAFFAGAFLAAFLVAICLFSLFDGLHRVLQHLLQLRKCIVSCEVSVKKKTTMEWKKWQQYLRTTGLVNEVFESKKVTRVKNRHSESGNCIMPTVREDTRPQISSEQRKQAEERAEHREHEHRAHSFVSMRCAEHESGEDHASRSRTLRPCRELSLKIPAKYKLFRDANQHAEQKPARDLLAVFRRQLRHRFRCLVV
jgi:hypothetical protein